MSAVVPRISVIIPTRNAGPCFEQTLRAIADQELGEPFEVLAIDSGSTDNTLDLCRNYGAQVTHIPPAQFGHGRTRNQAIAACRGEYVALIVQDAVPADSHWLRTLVATLDATPRAAGAYSRSLPHKDASFVARQVAEYWFNRNRQRVEQCISDRSSFTLLPYETKRLQCTFNNVSSMIRRSVWCNYPFRDIPFAEDLAWGYDILNAGYSVVYEPASRVYHSHERSNWYELRRAYVESRVVGELFDAPAQPLSGGHLLCLALLGSRMICEAALSGIKIGFGASRSPIHSHADQRPIYRRHFTHQVLEFIVGGPAPYPEAERRDLLFSLQERWERQNRRTSKHDAFGVRVYRAIPGQPERLDERIAKAVRHNDHRALSKRNLGFIFDALWDEIGADYVRRAVLEGGSPFSLELRIRHFADEFMSVAAQEGVSPVGLYRDTLYYATAIVIGQRLGSAVRYGAGGRWGHILERYVSRGI